MIWRRKPKNQPVRNPHLDGRKQAIFQYSSNRSQEARQRGAKEEPSPKKGKKPLAPRLPYMLVLLVGMVLAVYLSSMSGSQSKVVFADDQLTVRDKQQYIELANRLTGEGLHGYSKFTLNRQKISEEMTATYPEVADVQVTTPLFSRQPVVKLTLSRPVMVLAASNGRYLIDDRGVALLDLTLHNPGEAAKGLMSVDDFSDTALETGKPAMTTFQINFINEIKNQSEAKKMKIDSASLRAGGGELDVKYRGLPYFIKFNLYEDARKSFGTFIATREYIESKNIKPAEYIDVRISERAYIK